MKSAETQSLTLKDVEAIAQWPDAVEAARAVGVHWQTVYGWVRDEKVSYARGPGGQLRIDPNSLWKLYVN